MRWGRANAPSRSQQVQRALGKISVKHPRLKGKRVPVDPGLAVALSEHADRTSDRTLAWAARQITSLRFKEPERAAEIAKGFGQLLDWSDVALVLDSANKAQKINLLGMKISDAWEWQDFYHRLLASIVDGKVAIPSGWTQFQTGAALGISPGALRQMNSRHLSSRKAGNAIRVSEPGPLQQRLEVGGNIIRKPLAPGGMIFVRVHHVTDAIRHTGCRVDPGDGAGTTAGPFEQIRHTLPQRLHTSLGKGAAKQHIAVTVQRFLFCGTDAHVLLPHRFAVALGPRVFYHLHSRFPKDVRDDRTGHTRARCCQAHSRR